MALDLHAVRERNDWIREVVWTGWLREERTAVGVEEGRATLAFFIFFFPISIINYHAVGKDSRIALGFIPKWSLLCSGSVGCVITAEDNDGLGEFLMGCSFTLLWNRWKKEGCNSHFVPYNEQPCCWVMAHLAKTYMKPLTDESHSSDGKHLNVTFVRVKKRLHA